MRPTTNQQALGLVAEELLPDGTAIKKGPAFFIDKGQVHYELQNINEQQSLELRKQFRAITGFDLVISGKSGAAASSE